MRRSPLKRKPKKPRLRKLPSLKSLEDKAWRVFSVYIRSKDANGDDIGTCYTCGARKNWRELQGGHFIKRTHRAVKFDERNVRPQCPRCNLYLDGNQDEFAARIVRELGASVLEELISLKWVVKKFTREELNEIIKKYSDMTIFVDRG